MLEVRDIHTFYGESHVLWGVSLCVNEGEVVALLGRNGMGKSTTLKSIIGLTPPRSGRILYRGQEISRKSPFRIARLGLGYVPEDRRIFSELTVKENLEVAARARDGGPFSLDRVFELFPILAEREHQRGGSLSGGEQQMLAIARALMLNPQVLLLDEPSEGLSPLIVKTLGKQILQLKAMGMTILLAEMNVKFALTLSDRAYVLEKGQVRFEGTVRELQDNREIHDLLAV
ncbi:MAG: ABC transporter ATP-binding protein [candidate division NC10 bacterium]|nr:ABC transporter ATP-binding protein [candidate division NC10 bacterium]